MNALISDSYLEQQQWMHANKKQYGGAQPGTLLPVVLSEMDKHDVTEVIDYGAGKGHLGALLFRNGFRGDYIPYDPAVSDWDEHPEPAEMVVCIDVLEHVEPELLPAVLDDLQRLVLKVGVFSIHLRLAQKHLPDGRNAHLTVEPPEWWREQLAARFIITEEIPTVSKDDGLPLGHVFVVVPL